MLTKHKSYKDGLSTFTGPGDLSVWMDVFSFIIYVGTRKVASGYRLGPFVLWFFNTKGNKRFLQEVYRCAIRKKKEYKKAEQRIIEDAVESAKLQNYSGEDSRQS